MNNKYKNHQIYSSNNLNPIYKNDNPSNVDEPLMGDELEGDSYSVYIQEVRNNQNMDDGYVTIKIFYVLLTFFLLVGIGTMIYMKYY